MRLKGTLIEWNDARGFGFIEPVDGGGRVFCHVKAFAVRVRRPMPGDRVTYEIVKDAKGRLNAASVRPEGLEEARYNSNLRLKRGSAGSPRVSSSPSEASSSESAAFAYVGVAVFFAALITLVVMGRIPFFLPVIYLILSGLTIFAYAFDKSAAMNRRWRTQEQTLHVLELVGGWPGAWIAQKLFRHKSRKTSFRVEFWFCVLINVAALVWYAGLVRLPAW